MSRTEDTALDGGNADSIGLDGEGIEEAVLAEDGD